MPDSFTANNRPIMSAWIGNLDDFF